MRNRTVTLVVLSLLLISPVKATTGPSNILELLASRRANNAVVAVELGAGWTLSGRIGRIQRTEFYLLDATKSEGLAVAYADMRAVIDQSTGERFDILAPGPNGKSPRVHTSLKAWLIAGIVVGAFVIWYYSTGLNRA